MNIFMEFNLKLFIMTIPIFILTIIGFCLVMYLILKRRDTIAMYYIARFLLSPLIENTLAYDNLQIEEKHRERLYDVTGILMATRHVIKDIKLGRVPIHYKPEGNMIAVIYFSGLFKVQSIELIHAHEINKLGKNRVLTYVNIPKNEEKEKRRINLQLRKKF